MDKYSNLFFRCNYCCVSVSWCFVTTVHASSADSTMDHLTAIIIDNGTNGRQLYQLKTSFLPFSRRVFNISQFLSAPCSFPSSPLHVSVPLALKFKVVLFHSRAVSWIQLTLLFNDYKFPLRTALRLVLSGLFIPCESQIASCVCSDRLPANSSGSVNWLRNTYTEK